MTQTWIAPHQTEELVLDKNGTWLSNGEEITHQETCRGFTKNLTKDQNGYFVRIGAETRKVSVLDCAYFITNLQGNPKTGFQVRIKDLDSLQDLDPESLCYQQNHLSCDIQTPDGRIDRAKFLLPAYFSLLKDLQENDLGYFLEIEGEKISLAKKIH